jgi:Fe-S-cluster containining protein
MLSANENGEIPDCESCGACCAFSREWPALIGPRDGDGIPRHFIENGRMRCDGDRCSALAGTLGVDVSCKVYENRPLVCREFTAGSESCHTVRRHFGFGTGRATTGD